MSAAISPCEAPAGYGMPPSRTMMMPGQQVPPSYVAMPPGAVPASASYVPQVATTMSAPPSYAVHMAGAPPQHQQMHQQGMPGGAGAYMAQGQGQGQGQGPLRPSSEIPDPESIEKQKKMYERSLDQELEQSRRIAEQQVKARKEALKMQAEQQLAMYKAQLEQHLKAEELGLDQGLQQQQMALTQQLLHQKSILEQQASSLAMEYQQRKMREDMAKQQEDMHTEFNAMQQKMAQELQEHHQQSAALQAQHAQQATQMQQMQMQSAPAAYAPPYQAAQHQQMQMQPVAYTPPPQAAPYMQYAAPVTTAMPHPGMHAQYTTTAVAPSTARMVAAPQQGVQQSFAMPAAGASFEVGHLPQGSPMPGPPGATYAPAYTVAAGSAPGVHVMAQQPYPQQQQQGMSFAGSPGQAQVVYGAAPVTMASDGRRQSIASGPAVFDVIDRNHDGVISRAEWQQAAGLA